LQRDGINFFTAEAFSLKLEYGSIIKDPVQSTKQRRIFLKILAPKSGILVAGEDHVVVAFLVVTPVNKVKKQPGVLLVECTVPDFVYNETGSDEPGPFRQESAFPARLAAVKRSRSSVALMK
jgi:hypothetical protein